MAIELQQVVYFLAVVDHHSVSAAARSLGITQPALARAIGRLEQRLGAVLLTRSMRGVVLTAEGERFLRHARMIVNDCRRAAEDARAVSAGALGRVSLYCGSSFSQDVIGEAVRRIRETMPTAELSVAEGIVEEMLDALREGRCDAVFVICPEVVPASPVVFEPLMTINPTVVAGATHPFARRGEVTRADLAGQAWASMDHPYTLSVLTEFFTASRLPVPHPLRTNSLALLKSLVQTGRFLSLLPRHSVRREIRSGLIRRVPVAVAVRRPVAGLMYLEQRSRPEAVERALQVIRDVCAGLGDT